MREITHEQHVATVMVTHDLHYLDITDRALAMIDGRLADPNPTIHGYNGGEEVIQ